ncbi:MAG: SpoIIE family protein phosphatase [Flavobacteriales bacterium]|jgi:serine phosphatase RsbU (regulator of sigma subunit)|nr:SpoIIE family protein phosphatase [Flavobacteriales bacterium]
MLLYRYIFIFFSLLFSINSFSQTEEDLLKTLENVEGIEAASIYNQLAKEVLKSNPKKSIGYGNEAIKLANKNPNELSKAYINTGQGYYVLKEYEKAIEQYKKAITIYEKNRVYKGNAYGNLLTGRAYQKLNKKGLAINHLKKSYEISIQNNLYLYAGYAAHDLIEVYGDKGDISNVKKWTENAISGYKKANKDQQVIKVTFLYGAYLAQYGDYAEAKKQLEKASKKAKNNTKLAQEINTVLETIAYNEKIEKATISNHQQEQQKQTEKYIATIEKQKVLSLAEIEKLSEEKQLVELKLKIETDHYEKELLIQQHLLEQRNKDLAIKDANIETQIAIAKQHKIEKRNRTLQLIAAIIGIILVSFIALISFRNYQTKRKAYANLDLKNKQIQTQKEELEYKSKNIEKSIKYAQKIQFSLLPNEKVIQSIFSQSFVFFQPKDHVSGDFIWTHTIGNKSFLAVADCTGHGVPGAFISIICANLLEKIIVEEQIAQPNIILDKIDTELKQTINKYEEYGIKDGMDIALISITNDTLLYAGARNPLYIVSSNQLITLKGDRKSIGYGYSISSNQSFSSHEYSLKDGDMFYFSTDGYIDQRGGRNGNKFFAKPFRDLLLKIHLLPLTEQKRQLTQVFRDWKMNEEQMDDVTVLGFRFNS